MSNETSNQSNSGDNDDGACRGVATYAQILPHLQSDPYRDLMRACRFANTLSFLINVQLRIPVLKGTERAMAAQSGLLLTQSYMHELIIHLDGLYPHYKDHEGWSVLQELLGDPVLRKMRKFFHKVRRKAGFHFDKEVFADSLSLLSAHESFDGTKETFVVEDSSTGGVFEHHYRMVDLFALTFALKGNLPTTEEIHDLSRQHGAPLYPFDSEVASELAMRLDTARGATMVLASLLLDALRRFVRQVHIDMDIQYFLGGSQY